MTQYKLISDRLSIGTAGDIVDDKALADLNVAALIEGGHIELAQPVKQSSKSINEEK